MDQRMMDTFWNTCAAGAPKGSQFGYGHSYGQDIVQFDYSYSYVQMRPKAGVKD